jgi:hypothetical protein
MKFSGHIKWFLPGSRLCGFLLLVEIVLLVMASVDLTNQKELLEKNRHRLTRLNNRAIYPSSENVEKLQEHMIRMKAQAADFKSLLERDPFPHTPVEAADFTARAQGVVERVKKMAAQAGVAMPDTLEAGFSKYASGGMVPDAVFVPRLCRQLYSIEHIADVLVRSGVGSIDALAREEFENSGRPESPPRRRRPRSEASSIEISRSVQSAGNTSLYTKERIGVEFTGREDAVWRVLDIMARAPHSMAVVAFSHSTDSSILTYDPEKGKKGGGGENETLRYLSDGILTGQAARPRSERIIAGSTPIKVGLIIDAYNFSADDMPEDLQ